MSSPASGSVAVRARAHGYTMLLSDRRNRKFRDPGLGAQAATSQTPERGGALWYHAPPMAAKRLSLKAFGAITPHRRSRRLVDGRRAHVHLIHTRRVAHRARSVAALAGGLDRRGRHRVPAHALLEQPFRAACAFRHPRSRRGCPVAVPAALYIWTGPLRGWLWTVLRRGHRRPRGGAPHATVADADRARPAAARRGWPRRSPPSRIWPVPGRSFRASRPATSRTTSSSRRASSRITICKSKTTTAAGDYHDYYGGDLRPDYLRRGQNGEIYSVHAPGLSVLVAPVLAVFGYPGVLAFLALRQRVRDGADVDGHVARHVGRGGQLVRLGDGRA